MSARLLLLSLLAALPLGGCGGSGGPAGGTTTSPQSISTPHSSPRGRLVTLIGSRDSAGLHWVLIGDGFTAAQQEDLRATGLAMGKQLLETPEIAQHASVWNVHLLQTDSAESGVDDPAAGQFVNTPFHGALGCGSNTRVACVDWSAIHDALAAEKAPPAQLTVVLNTPLYVGSSNTSGIVVSRNEHAGLIVVHELGHRVAGLADEYVDAVVAGEQLPFYVEGRFPNVTTQSQAGQAPWRHWMDAGTSEVGLFEGAYYVANGFYRAKQDSLMRTLEAPLGEVNAEAWLRAQYRALPPLTAARPEAASVRGLPGENLEFSVVSAWPREVVELRWTVDGVEPAGSRNLATLRWTADGAEHRVEVVANDVSGRIRSPEAAEAHSVRAWTVSPSAVPSPQKASPMAQATAWLKMRVDGAGHTVLGRQSVAPFAAPMAAAGPADWNYTLLDTDGLPVAAGVVADPRHVTTALPAPGQPHGGHGSLLLESGIYFIGIPQGADARKLRVSATAVGREKLAWTGSVPAGAIELALDPP